MLMMIEECVELFSISICASKLWFSQPWLEWLIPFHLMPRLEALQWSSPSPCTCTHPHTHTHTHTPPHPTGVSTLLCWGSSTSDQATISWCVTQHKCNPRSSQGWDEPVCILLPQSFYGAVKSPRAALRGWGINQSELLEWTGNRKVLIVLYCNKTQCVVSSFHVRVVWNGIDRGKGFCYKCDSPR